MPDSTQTKAFKGAKQFGKRDFFNAVTTKISLSKPMWFNSFMSGRARNPTKANSSVGVDCG